MMKLLLLVSALLLAACYEPSQACPEREGNDVFRHEHHPELGLVYWKGTLVEHASKDGSSICCAAMVDYGAFEKRTCMADVPKVWYGSFQQATWASPAPKGFGPNDPTNLFEMLPMPDCFCGTPKPEKGAGRISCREPPVL